MNSKKALSKLYMACDDELLYEQNGIMFPNELYTIIEKDLDRLEKLEKENKVLREKVNHFKNIKNRYRRNEKFVEKENAKLKKTIEILKDKLEITLYSHDEYFNPPMINGTEIFKNLTQEEYELLKEVLG